MSTDDPERKDGRDEPRAKDLLTRPRAELEEAMDPDTLAQLASWFDMPNLALVEEQAEAEAAQSEEEKEREERRKRKEAACAAADPKFLRHIERHERTRIHVLPEFELDAIVDESIVNVAVRAQLERQSADEPAGDLLEYSQPPDVQDIVARHNAPQALLRDLFRPVSEFEGRFESPFDELPDLDPAREVREALRQRIVIEWIDSPFRQGVSARAAGKAIMREPWPAHLEAVQELKKARGY
ncbi:MAG: hypothetical protein F9K40_21135 [Kofleriaceae bacterium]|nr:MAG: hypothetical protein F9K40_21135 [Kofleriaceae bacterium]MBZ0236973.1 hypothetical protein [Kofleriaceae bacterium]